MRLIRRNDLLCFKLIKPHKKICLIQPVLTQQGRSALCCIRQLVISRRIDKCRIKNPFQIKLAVHRLRHMHDLIITLSRGTDDHLCTLTGRDKTAAGVAFLQHLFPCDRRIQRCLRMMIHQGSLTAVIL